MYTYDVDLAFNKLHSKLKTDAGNDALALPSAGVVSEVFLGSNCLHVAS